MIEHYTVEQLRQQVVGDTVYIVTLNNDAKVPTRITSGYYKICSSGAQFLSVSKDNNNFTFYYDTYGTSWVAYLNEADAVQAQQGNVLKFAQDIAALFYPDADYAGYEIKSAVLKCVIQYIQGK